MRKNLPMLLVRVMVGVVFLTEGILKFLRPEELGWGRFAHLGFPMPHLLAPFVGAVEVLGGAAVLLGLFAGDGALALFLVIATAIVTTKIPILLGHPLGRLGPPHVAHHGVWSFLHEARTDLCMLLGTLAVLLDRGLKLGRKTKWFER